MKTILEKVESELRRLRFRVDADDMDRIDELLSEVVRERKLARLRQLDAQAMQDQGLTAEDGAEALALAKELGIPNGVTA